MKCSNPYCVKPKGSIYERPANFEFYVPCGKCLYCRTQRRKEWTLRLLMEKLYYKESSFVTLTYNDENLPKGNTLKKVHLQNYFKRLRRAKLKFKYYSAGEYGEESKRAHYHVIFLGIAQDEKLLKEKWPYGHIHTGYVSTHSIRYTAQYIDKKIYGENAKEHYGVREPEFQVVSQGMGKTYLYENLDNIMDDGYIMLDNIKHRIPRYFIKKIIDDPKIDRIKKADFIRRRSHEAVKKECDSILNLVEVDETLDKLPQIFRSDYDQKIRIQGKQFNNYLKRRNESKEKRKKL